MPGLKAGASPDFLSGGGEMGAIIRGHDWKTSLGQPQTWPAPLKTLAGVMLSSLQPMFIAWGPKRIWLSNDAFTPILGGKHPHALGRPAMEVWAEAREVLEPLFARVFAGEPVHMDDFAIQLDRHGRLEEAHFAFAYTPVRDDSGKVAGLFGTCIETTAQVRALRDVAESENQFRTMAQAMPNHVWTAPPDGMLDWFNDRIYEFSGAAPGTLDGTGWSGMVHPEDLPAVGARWADALAAGEIYETEFRLRRADGAYRWHIARAVPVKDASGQTVRWIGTNTEIQDQKEISETLSDLNATLEQRVQERTSQLSHAEDALRQSQKMEAVGQLTGGIAHDFNNLLQGITGALDRIQHRITDGRVNDIERFLTGATASAKRAAAMTQRLLAFSRRQTLDPKPVNLDHLIEEVVELARHTVGPGIEMKILGGGAWQTLVDPNQLENVLLNLCINARDAMPEGGAITIETVNTPLDAAAASRFNLAPGDYISLCVSDTGTGMTPDVMARAFDPFFTTKPLGQGTGLGLSMIYGFAQQSGGHVRLSSRVGEGTLVQLYLPRCLEQKPAEDGPVPVIAAAEPGRGQTILVVDDEAIIRMMIIDAIEDAGYAGLQVGDGAAGLKILQSEARVDLLVTDVGLPGGLNGRQLADAARLKRPGLRVLFITGYAEKSIVGDGDLESGMEILPKPFMVEELTAKIREMVQT